MLLNLQIEWLKLKHSKILLIATILPLFAVLQGRIFAAGSAAENTMNSWQLVFTGSLAVYSSLILPLVITIVMAMMARIEHSQNGWKHLLVLPIKREDVYLSKLLVGMAIILYNIVILIVGMLIAGLSIGDMGAIPYELVVQRPLLMLISAFPIIAIQFYVSNRFSHVGVPLAIGVGLALPSMLVANSATYWIFYPWTYPILTALTEIFSMDSRTPWMYAICLGAAPALILIGLLEFHKKDIL